MLSRHVASWNDCEILLLLGLGRETEWADSANNSFSSVEISSCCRVKRRKKTQSLLKWTSECEREKWFLQSNGGGDNVLSSLSEGNVGSGEVFLRLSPRVFYSSRVSRFKCNLSFEIPLEHRSFVLHFLASNWVFIHAERSSFLKLFKESPLTICFVESFLKRILYPKAAFCVSNKFIQWTVLSYRWFPP